MKEFGRIYQGITEAVSVCKKFGYFNQPPDKKKPDNKWTFDGERKNSFSHSSSANPSDTAFKPCYGCGKNHKPPCNLSSHPDFNSDSTKTWAESEKGKAWAAKNRNTLPQNKDLNGNDVSVSDSLKNSKTTSEKPAKKSGFPNKKCKCHEYINTLSASIFYDDYLPCTIHRGQEIIMEIDVLIDTGALNASYINSSVADKLISLNYDTVNSKSSICGAFSNVPCNVSDSVIKNIGLTFTNEQDKEHIIIDCKVIDMPYDLILGRPDIRRYDILRKCGDMFNVSDSCLTRGRQEITTTALRRGIHKLRNKKGFHVTNRSVRGGRA